MLTFIFYLQRYRTPSRSRSRSRSVTPPHWKQAQKRIIRFSDLEVEHNYAQFTISWNTHNYTNSNEPTIIFSIALGGRETSSRCRD